MSSENNCFDDENNYDGDDDDRSLGRKKINMLAKFNYVSTKSTELTHAVSSRKRMHFDLIYPVG